MRETKMTEIKISEGQQLNFSDAHGYWPQHSSGDLLLPLRNLIICSVDGRPGRILTEAQVIFRDFDRVKFEYYRQLSSLEVSHGAYAPESLKLSERLEASEFTGLCQGGDKNTYNLGGPENTLPITRDGAARFYVVKIEAIARDLVIVPRR
jgi:hypothetical protein